MRPARRTLLVAALLLVPISSARAQTGPDPAGHWEGKVRMPTGDVPMTVDLAKPTGGAWIGSLSIPGTTTIDVPLSHITFDDAGVQFAAALPDNPTFEGKLSADANDLSGEAKNAKGGVPFQLTRNGAANVKLPPPSSRLVKEFEGMWEGTLEVNGKVMRIALKLSAAADGTATGALVSLDQGNEEIPLTTVTLKDTQVELEARSISGTYRGTLGANGEIAGEWAQGGVHLPLNFKHQ